MTFSATLKLDYHRTRRHYG